MYDDVVKTVGLTADELEIIIDALERAQDFAVGIGEIVTYEMLLEKLKAE